MQTIEGDRFIVQFAKWLRSQERRLAAHAHAPQRRVVTTGSALLGSWAGGQQSPLTLELDLHHLSFLLVKFEECDAIPIDSIGPLDWALDMEPSRPLSMLSVLSALPQTEKVDRSDAMSFISGLSWLTSGSSSSKSAITKDQELQDVKYLYSAITKIPSLHLSPRVTPPSMPAPLDRFITSFESLPDASYVPLYAFKNLTRLVISDLDPRCLLGWDVLSENLRILEVRHSGLDNLDEWLVDSVCSQEAWHKTGRKPSQRPALRSRRSRSNEDSDCDNSRNQSLKPSKWRQLRKLSLSSNFLASLPPEPWINFQSLVSLDLSNNLLVSIPNGLTELVSLRSLNLSENMIDSILNISSLLGAITTLNLSKNRLSSLCGLERLKNLDSIDVTCNAIDDVAEVGRLAQLPNLRVLYASEGNAFAKANPSASYNIFASKSANPEARLSLLVLFAQEGNGSVQLDGSPASWIESRSIESEMQKKPRLRERHHKVGVIQDGKADTVSRRIQGRRNPSSLRAVTMPRAVTSPVSVSPQKGATLGRTTDLPPVDTSEFLKDSRPHEWEEATPTDMSSKVSSPKKRQRPHVQRVVNLDGNLAFPALSSATSVPLTDNEESLSSETRNVEPDMGAHLRSSSENTQTLHVPKRVISHKHESATVGRHARSTKRSARVSASMYEESNADRKVGGEAHDMRDKIARLRKEHPDDWLLRLNQSSP